MTASRESADSEFVFRLPRRALRNAGIAFGAGLLLFVVVWLSSRDKGFYQPEATLEGPKPALEALPEPLPAGDGASGLEEPHAQGNERPQLVEQAPLPAAIEEAPAPEPAPAPAPPASTSAGAVTLAPGQTPVPIPGQMPPPQYPAIAMRRGETGTVQVRVEVGVDGIPTDVSIEQRSGSRDLDRAAMDAVRHWRFQPAQRDGQAIATSVVIPIDFNLQQ